MSYGDGRGGSNHDHRPRESSRGGGYAEHRAQRGGYDRQSSREYPSQDSGADRYGGDRYGGGSGGGSYNRRPRSPAPYGEPSTSNGSGVRSRPYATGLPDEKRRRTDSYVKEEERSTTYGEGSSSAMTPVGGGGDEGGDSVAAVNPRRRMIKDERNEDGTPVERKKRDRLEMVVSRTDAGQTKKGTSGKPLQLQANYFRLLKKPSWSLYQYHVNFEPKIELVGLRKRFIYEQKPILGGYLYDNNAILYLTQRIPNDLLQVQAQDRDGNAYAMTIKWTSIVEMTTKESLQVLNVILRRSMDGLHLQLINRNLYDAANKIDIREHNIQLWPGYQTSIRQHEQDLMVCTDLISKVMRTDTVYGLIKNSFTRNRQNLDNFQEEVMTQVLGLTVLTDYNNRTYRIDDIDFTTNPSSTFETKNGTTSFVDYYRQKYNIEIKDKQQPMLISRAKERQLRGGGNELVSLIPELCRITGLSDEMRKNFRLMASMSDQFRMRPHTRTERLLDFNKRLNRTQESVEVLNQFNLKMDTNLVEIPGRLLQPQIIRLGGSKKVPASIKADWQNVFRDSQMTKSIALYHWSLIHPIRATRETQDFLRALKNVSRTMGFEVTDPTLIPMRDDSNASYIRAIEDCIHKDIQLVFVIVGNNNADRYANIKKKCYIERSITSQVVCQRTITPKKGSVMSVATKVAIQMNCKLGGVPWMIDIPPKELMVIGIDVSHDTRDRGKSFGAVVACLDPQQGKADYFSAVAAHKNGEELSNSIIINITKAVHAYKDACGSLPKKIIIYRDGVGDGQLAYVHEVEVARIKECLANMYPVGENGKSFQLCFVVVSKRINTRIFNNRNNPDPGTVVDDVITMPERYDFYLVSQSVNQGTVSPTSYHILSDNMGLSPDRLQQLTYKMTHLYYNWSGTLRVPAVCQYAHKLAFLVGQYLHQSPNEGLSRRLYFL